MNSLFIHAEPGEPWFNWGNSLDLIKFWMLGLMALGFSRWTGSSMVKSADDRGLALGADIRHLGGADLSPC